MISLKQLIGRKDEESAELVWAQARMIDLLLDGLVLHTVRCDPEEHEAFAFDISSVKERLASNPSPEEMLIATGGALKSFQEHSRRTSLAVHAQGKELHKIMSMLTAAVLQLGSASEQSSTRLQDIEKQLEKSSALNDIRKLKDQLGECLSALREEKIRQRQSADATISTMKQGLHTGEEALRVVLDPPPAMSDSFEFGSRPDAEAALATALDGRRNAYAALFVIDHLDSLNTRFGRKIGDQVIATFTEHLTQHLQATDSAFRWSGPSFMALLDRAEPLDRVRREITPMVSARLERTIDNGKRSVLLPIHFTWTLIPVRDYEKTGLMIEKLDAFSNGKRSGPGSI